MTMTTNEVVPDASHARYEDGSVLAGPPSQTAPSDPEAGLSSVDAFVLCALILAAVAAAAGPIAAGIQRVGTTISGLIP